jgi:hypothetical protein
MFIYDSYACRKNKGVHAAVARVDTFIRSLKGRGGSVFYLQLDIKSFFLVIFESVCQWFKLSKMKGGLKMLARSILAGLLLGCATANAIVPAYPFNDGPGAGADQVWPSPRFTAQTGAQ